MRLLDTIKSKVDKTVKFVFQLSDGLIFEIAYINKDDGKDILCVSSQSACLQGCKFCYTTKFLGKLQVRNIRWNEISSAVEQVYRILNLDNQKLLLVSYMGCGEPLLNMTGVFSSMNRIHKVFPNSRFALASLFPQDMVWRQFTNFVACLIDNHISVKFHWSLHFTEDSRRKLWMPKALTITDSLGPLVYLAKKDFPIEIHYALIQGINDRPEDALRLKEYAQQIKASVKFLRYNTDSPKTTKEQDMQIISTVFNPVLSPAGIKTEYYCPPGVDVGASCGQFLFDYYLKYNLKRSPE